MNNPQITGLALTLLALGVSGCSEPKAADARTADRVVLSTTVGAAGTLDRAYTGIVVARVQSDLGFRVPGKVVARLVDTGQIVKQGQKLMRIDATDYAHAVTAQAGDVAAARARWLQAAADEKRYRALVSTGATSQSTYDQAKASADSARALLEAAEAQEKVARNQGDYSVLSADADGTIVETLAEPGQVVSAGQIVMRLAHAGPREAAVDLPETERPALGSEATADLYGGTATATAHLRQLSDAADPLTRTYEARYVLDGGGATAPLGATVTLHLSDTAEAAAGEIPLAALDDEGHGAGIWVIDPATSKVRFTPVDVARFGRETAVVSRGAAPGQKIVAAGGHYLHEGEHVQLAGEKASMR